MELNSAKYDLPSQVKLRVIGKNHIGIIKLIKSRIIQKDAVKIIEISKKLKKIDPKLTISLICTSNICSKSLLLLESESIQVIIEKL